MAYITENHINSIENIGSKALSVYAKEVNFVTSVLNITHKWRTSNSCSLRITHLNCALLENIVPFIGQWIEISGVDSTFFDGIFKITNVVSESTAVAVVTYEHYYSDDTLEETVSAGTVTPVFARGFTEVQLISGDYYAVPTSNSFELTGVIPEASDYSANKVIIAGKRGVYYTDLDNVVSIMGQDSINHSFALELNGYFHDIDTAPTPNDIGFLLRSTNGVSLMITIGGVGGSGARPYLTWDTGHMNYPLIKSPDVGFHYTDRINALNKMSSGRSTLILECYKSLTSQNLQRLRLMSKDTGEVFSDITIDDVNYRLNFPLYIGDCAGIVNNNSILTADTNIMGQMSFSYIYALDIVQGISPSMNIYAY